MPAATELPEQAPWVAREAGTAVAAVVVVVATALAYGWSLGFHAENAHNGLLGGSFTAVGLYVVRMRARHREGRLLLATGVLHAGMFFARQYGLDDGALPAASWVGWLGVWPLPLVIATAGWTFMAFPDGRLPSARWRAGVATMFAVASVLAVTSTLWPVEYDRMRLAAPHPLDVPGAEVAARFWEYGLPSSYLAFQVLWTVAIVVRMRRARGEVLRQTRWLVYAVVLAALLLVGGLLLLGSPVLGLLALPLVPVAAGFAILKLRLYDIDPVLNRSLVVGAMLVPSGTCSRTGCLVKTPRHSRAVGEFFEPAFDEVGPGTRGRGEVQVPAAPVLVREPRADLGDLVRGQVVQHDVRGQCEGHAAPGHASPHDAHRDAFCRLALAAVVAQPCLAVVFTRSGRRPGRSRSVPGAGCRCAPRSAGGRCGPLPRRRC